MSGTTAIVWVRKDCRVHDNEPLATAVEEASTVLPVYCFDPREFGEGLFDLPKIGPYRARFVRESVRDLRESLRTRGGDLLVRRGKPEIALPELAAEYGVDATYFHEMPTTEERAVEAAVGDALDRDGIDRRRFWGKTLYHVDDLPTAVDDIDDTFTPWRKRVERDATVREPFEAPVSVPVPEIEAGAIPSLVDLGIDPRPIDDRGVLDFEGGETAGRNRLETYLWEEDRLREYKETRNGLLGSGYSSKLSAWLAQGCLSPRHVYAEVDRYEDERVANASTYWLVFELLWRDFFTFQFVKHGAAFFASGGIQGKSIDWRTDREVFDQWACGETGVPFVDANVRELNETGYVSNRGRQNVASFLVDWLGIDWRMGAAYFEATLIDYDVCSNWGNWAYQAGVGNDSRDRYFDVLEQAERYDPNGEYVRHWVPELADIPGAAIHTPWTLTADERARHSVELGREYPWPMIDLDATRRRLSR